MQLDRLRSGNQNEYQEQQYILEKMVKRFATYGYKQVRTPVFEDYDLYQKITGTVRKEEMIKVIAPAGNILVLRPDVTIPITRREAMGDADSQGIKRFCYTSSVFRSRSHQEELTEQIQAGIENFETQSTELDAEVIALSIHILQDFGFSHFKLVIGHAGFFKELINHVNISEQETEQLQMMIQAKNLSGIETFLDKLAIDEQSKHAFMQVPLLYGNPKNVMNRASEIAINKPMQEKVERMVYLLEVLTMFEVESFVTFDFGLINHMNYYSDIIFQGFVEKFGKPVVMGGRYNHLAEQFNKPTPAIGFAFDMDNIFECLKQQMLFPTVKRSIDIHIYYTYSKQKEALTTAQWLRRNGIHVLHTAMEQPPKKRDSETVLYFQDRQNLLDSGDGPKPFTNKAELLNLLKGET